MAREPFPTAAGSPSAPTRIPPNLRLLGILEVLAKADAPLTATEINAALGLPKQSIHRLCATLVREGFLAYESDGRRLRPARRMRTLAAGLMTASRLHIARHQIMVELAAQVRETVNFVMPGETGMNYVDRVETDWAFRVQLPVGTSVPFHCTASGKTFLASLSGKARAAMLAAIPLPKLTDRTITDPGAMARELDAVARDGHALDREEFVDGMIAIAVPIRDEAGRFLAALAFHGPTLRLDEAKLLAQRGVLEDAAARIARAMTAG